MAPDDVRKLRHLQSSLQVASTLGPYLANRLQPAPPRPSPRSRSSASLAALTSRFNEAQQRASQLGEQLGTALRERAEARGRVDELEASVQVGAGASGHGRV